MPRRSSRAYLLSMLHRCAAAPRLLTRLGQAEADQTLPRGRRVRHLARHDLREHGHLVEVRAVEALRETGVGVGRGLRARRAPARSAACAGRGRRPASPCCPAPRCGGRSRAGRAGRRPAWRARRPRTSASPRRCPRRRRPRTPGRTSTEPRRVDLDHRLADQPRHRVQVVDQQVAEDAAGVRAGRRSRAGWRRCRPRGPGRCRRPRPRGCAGAARRRPGRTGAGSRPAPRTPDVSTSSTSARISSRWLAIGFSHSVGTPAAMAARSNAGWVVVGVASRTPSTGLSSASRSSHALVPGSPADACAARPGTGSKSSTSSTSSRVARLVACMVPIRPTPATPIRIRWSPSW